jgi:hypothetical protein
MIIREVAPTTDEKIFGTSPAVLCFSRHRTLFLRDAPKYH